MSGFVDGILTANDPENRNAMSAADDLAGLVEVGEQVLVEALIAEVAIEAFDKTILHRFAGRDGVPFDLTFFLPGRTTFEVNLVPLLLTIMRRQPRISPVVATKGTTIPSLLAK
jgi:hypothetical protein